MRDNFFLSYETVMFNYVAYMSQVVGNTIPHGMCRGTLGEVIACRYPDLFVPPAGSEKSRVGSLSAGLFDSDPTGMGRLAQAAGP